MAEPEEEVEMESDAADAGGPIPFQLQLDKPLPFQIRIAEWNPEKDLLAMVTEDSKVVLHRFNWQRLWMITPVGFLSRLEKLSITGNSLICLPKTIGDLSNLPENLLKDCKALQNVSPHDNPISMDQFQQMEGFEEFEERRKKKYDKQIDSNVMMSSKGLDEGIDL